MPIASPYSPISAEYRGRFAPSPTGPLHFGSLVAAVGSWLRARAAGGVWLVRIEDIDPPREVPGAAREILETLAAFGMESDEPVLFQSGRTDAYALAFERLRAGGHVFSCRCSRSELATGDGVHPAQCPDFAEATLPIRARTPLSVRKPAWRVRVGQQTVAFRDQVQGDFAQQLDREVGAFVIKRVEGWFAYQLAVVVDDAEQRITEIVRGCDLLDSTPRQIWLQGLLGYPTPSYMHLPLALDAAGRKLSKQDRARPVDRHDPIPALRAALGFLGLREIGAPMGNTPMGLLQRALTQFDPQGIPRVAGATELA